MAFIPVEGVVGAFMRFTGPDEVMCGWSLNFLDATSAVTPGDLAAIGNYLVDWHDTSLKPLMTAGWDLEAVELRDRSAANSYIDTVAPTLSGAGTRVGNSMPSSVAWSIKFATGLAGRSYRGRVYWMGMAEADISGNFIDPTYATSVEAAWETMRTGIFGEVEYRLCVVSLQTGGQPRSFGVATPVTDILAVDSIVDTQRRRLPRA